MEVITNKKPTVTAAGSKPNKKVNQMQSRLYQEYPNPSSEIVQDLAKSFQELTAVLGSIHLCISESGDDKALMLCQEMETAAMLISRQIRTQLNVPY